MRNRLNPPEQWTLISLEDQWDDHKDIRNFTEKSSYKAQWKCVKSHTWTATIRERTKGGTNCPYCKGRKVWKGFNDLVTLYPKLVKEWDDTKDVFTVLAGSHYKAQWKCKKGHVWKADVRTRTKGGNNCPYCAGQRAIVGKNDLTTTHPEIAAEWNDEKRDILTVMAGTNYKASWKCSEKHIYTALVSTRTNPKIPTGCPYCSGRKPVQGVNDLISTHGDSELLKEWYDEKNPSVFSAGSTYKAQWKCKKGHIWKTRIVSRTKGHKCPYCAGNKVLPETQLTATHPELVKEWDDKRDPTTVSAGSGHKVQWKCKKGHIWKAPIYSRTNPKVPTGCPPCFAGSSVSKMEQAFHDWIAFVLPKKFKIIQSDRKILKGKELDVYIPDLNIAFEFNGTYWHSEYVIQKIKGTSAIKHHSSKKSIAAQAGVDLYYVWEEDWVGKTDDVKSEIQDLLLHHGKGSSFLLNKLKSDTLIQKV